jgi:hypothetical protein
MENEIEVKKNKPVKIIMCGGVKGSVWANTRLVEGEKKVIYSVSITKNYKDVNTGEWRECNSYSTKDLSLLVMVSTACFVFISEQI